MPVAEDTTLNQMTVLQNAEGRFEATLDLDIATGEELCAALDPLCRPVPLPDGSPDPRSINARRAEAIGQVLRTYLSQSRRPMSGGVLPHVTLIRPAVSVASGDETVDRLGFAGPVSGVTAELIACDATLTSVIVDQSGVPLDVGRAERLFTPAIRKALAVRDGGCPSGVRAAGVLVRCPPHPTLERRRRDQPHQRGAALPAPPHPHPSRWLAGLPRPRPPPLVHPTPHTGPARTGASTVPRPPHHDRPTDRRITPNVPKAVAHLDN
ncbi:DUF222 domain-containing protein, partial [Mycolicibacterium neoaurum]|uniref:DUF222 domain-containing protein n=1 Tax=Mycolicibacterium neoaurum TaxID=1795 RepID=UPI003F684C59